MALSLDNVVETSVITDGQKVEFYKCLISQRSIPLGKSEDVIALEHPLAKFDKPTKLTLTVTVNAKSDKRKLAENHWDFGCIPTRWPCRRPRAYSSPTRSTQRP